MLASHLIYFYLTMESSTQVLLADKTKTSNRVSTPHNNQDYFEFQMNLLAGSEQFTELKEPLVIGAPLMQQSHVALITLKQFKLSDCKINWKSQSVDI